jgi:hypothetical protein
MVHQTEVAVGWWIAEKGAPLAYLGPTEVNQEAAKTKALAKSTANPGTVFQVRYHMNANAPAEVRWEAVEGGLTEVTGDKQPAGHSGITELDPRHDAVPPSASTAPPAKTTISNTWGNATRPVELRVVATARWSSSSATSSSSSRMSAAGRVRQQLDERQR